MELGVDETFFLVDVATGGHEIFINEHLGVQSERGLQKEPSENHPTENAVPFHDMLD